jgi:Ser/Thr protein kinase RdoA (MazF antagonist)
MGFEPILTSFFDPEALAARLEAAYGLQHVRCQLITATLRDVYLVESHVGRHILIIYRHGQRTWGEIAAEWRFVDYLVHHSVPVAPAIATTARRSARSTCSAARSRRRSCEIIPYVSVGAGMLADR